MAAGLLMIGCAPDGSTGSGPGAGEAVEAAWARFGLLAGTCADEVRASLVEWRAGDVAIEAPPGPSGERVLRLPTDEPGRWVVVEGAGRGLHLVEASGTRTRTFSEGCVPSDRRTRAPAETEASASGEATASRAFTDAGLRAALAETVDDGLIVYAWSPHMPLSVDGWTEISSAARMRGLRVLPVVIAHGDADFARREAARGGIPPEGLREVASVELIMRDLQLHAPSILVFRAGRVSPVLPGYRNAEGYGRFLDAFEAGG